MAENVPKYRENLGEFFSILCFNINASVGILVGLGFLFIGFIQPRFVCIIVGSLPILTGVISASLLSLKQIKNEKK